MAERNLESEEDERIKPAQQPHAWFKQQPKGYPAICAICVRAVSANPIACGMEPAALAR
jgi:hypothetical protein